MKVEGQDPIHKSFELILWVTIISALILTNISFSALSSAISKEYILLLLVVLGCIIFIAIDKFIKEKVIFHKRIFLDVMSGIFIVWLLYTIYNFVSFEYILFFVPIILAISLSTIVVVNTRWVSIGLVVVVCFLLGDVYWGGEIEKRTIFTFPVTFLRIFSLSLVVLFGFYLYKMRDKAAGELREKNIQLSKVKRELEQRTQELSTMNERLEELDKLKTKFISTVSHELRTPLTAISNSTNILKKIFDSKDYRNEKIEELLDLIVKNTKRQKTMVENLLNLSRIEKKSTGGNREKVKISNPLKEAVESLQYQAESKSVELIMDLPKEIPEVWCVSSEIQRVFSNLIDNAIEYTSENGKVIVKVKDQGKEIRCSVRDFGPGIKKENLVKIFDRFLQGKNKSSTKGIGLGLAICKEIIQSHGGDIWVESEVEEGSEFIFKIPSDLRKEKR